jgi:hypothetical protein
MRTRKPRASSNERCTRKAETLPNSEPPLIGTRTAFFTKSPVALGGCLAGSEPAATPRTQPQRGGHPTANR